MAESTAVDAATGGGIMEQSSSSEEESKTFWGVFFERGAVVFLAAVETRGFFGIAIAK
jgi:hypothetical protein